VADAVTQNRSGTMTIKPRHRDSYRIKTHQTKTTISVEVEPNFKRRLVEIAKTYGIGLSYMIREMLEQEATKWEEAYKEAQEEKEANNG
jgi:predicted transcriptional regulator